MRNKLAFVWLAAAVGILALAARPAAAVSFSDTFNNTTGSTYPIWSALTETPVANDGGAGNLWGGWAPNTATTTNRIQIVTGDKLRITGNATATKNGNQTGAYAYTIFPGGVHVDGIKAVSITVTNTLAAEEIRLLIRDKVGDWFLSQEKFAVGSAQAYSFLDPSTLTWLQVPGAAQTEMNLLNGPDSGPGDISTAAGGSIDISQVTGGGLYIETGSTDGTNFDISSISWDEPVGVLGVDADPQGRADSAVVPPPVPTTSPGVPTVASVTVDNAGLGNLTITSISIINDVNGSFSLNPANPTPGAPLTPGDSASFQVIYNPSVAGLTTGTLSILSNTGGVPGTVTNVLIRSGVIVDNTWSSGSDGLWTDATWSLGHSPLFYERAHLDTYPTVSNTGNFYVDSDADFCAHLVVTSGTLSLLGNQVFSVSDESPAQVDQSGGSIVKADAGGSSHLYMARAAAGNGTYNMTGGFLDTGRQLQVGQYGTAVFNLSGSGAINVGRNFQIGNQPTANGTFNMSGGSLTMEAGYPMNLGTLAGAVGVANITGGTLTNTGGGIFVGVAGTGTLSVGGTAVVTASGPLSVGDALGGQGTVTISGGTVTVDSVTTGSGAMTAFDLQGGTLKTGDLFASGQPVLPFNWTGGNLLVAGTSGISLTVPAGSTFGPGNSVGVTTFSGAADFSMNSAATLEIELASALSADQIVMGTGTAYLDGTLTVVALSPYSPQIFDEWEIVTGAHSGAFAAINGPALPLGGQWEVDYTDPTKVVLRAAPATGVQSWKKF